MLEVMESILTILRFEGRDKFAARWKILKKLASRVHNQMASLNDQGLGAIQATDIIREELRREAVQLSRKRSAQAVSRRVQALGTWAANRKRENGGSMSSPDNVSSPESESQLPDLSSDSRLQRTQLELTRVSSDSCTVAMVAAIITSENSISVAAAVIM